MAATASTMIPLGTTAPAFTLPDAISGQMMSLDDLKSDTATVVMFICNHCPYVKHVQTQLVVLARNYQARGGRLSRLTPMTRKVTRKMHPIK